MKYTKAGLRLFARNLAIAMAFLFVGALGHSISPARADTASIVRPTWTLVIYAEGYGPVGGVATQPGYTGPNQCTAAANYALHASKHTAAAFCMNGPDQPIPR